MKKREIHVYPEKQKRFYFKNFSLTASIFCSVTVKSSLHINFWVITRNHIFFKTLFYESAPKLILVCWNKLNYSVNFYSKNCMQAITISHRIQSL